MMLLNTRTGLEIKIILKQYTMNFRNVLLLGSALVILACDKEEEPKKSEIEQQLIGAWTESKIEELGEAGNWIDFTRPCDLDDVSEFLPSGKYALYQGVNICEGGDHTVLNGAWRLGSNDTKIIFTYEAYSGEYERSIESFTATQMVLKHATGETVSRQIRTTYVKK